MAPSPSAKDATEDASYCISYDNVLEAAERIKGIAHRTPVLTSSSFDANGRRIFFKVEAMQRTGSFKFRGALNAVKTEVSNTSSESLTVVTHSSGNHAAAVALASRLASTDETTVSATIVMPNNAPAIKKAGVEGFGGNIVSVENTPEAREAAADEIMKKSGGSTFVHPSEDPRVIAGQGTVSLELVSQMKELGHDVDAVIIPVGGEMLCC
jgi:threonine dehydratase